MALYIFMYVSFFVIGLGLIIVYPLCQVYRSYYQYCKELQKRAEQKSARKGSSLAPTK